MSMTHDEMIAVIAAHRDGKEIQLQWRHNPNWITITPHPNWHFDEADYRIKPEPPKPREFWIGIHRWENDVQACISFHEGRERPEGCDSPEVLHVREVLPEEEGKA